MLPLNASPCPSPAFLISLNASLGRPGYGNSMTGQDEELARVERRIADVRRAIEQGRDCRGWSGGAGEQERILALLSATLKSLEARKKALQIADN